MIRSLQRRLRGLPALLAVLLLFAQQGALTHALGHAAGHAHAQTEESAAHGHHGHAAAAHDDEAPSRNISELCAFDLVYSQVLGGVHAAFALPVIAIAAPAAVPADTPCRGGRACVAYDSRGPPAFS